MKKNRIEGERNRERKSEIKNEMENEKDLKIKRM